MGRPAPMLCGLLVLCACQRTPAPAPSNDDDQQAPNTSSSSGGGEGTGTTFTDASACEQSAECMGGHCVAPYDPGVGTIGSFVCVGSCVEAGDLARACRDDASCCAGLVCNPVDGFCNSQDMGTTSAGSSSGGSGSSSSGGSSSGGSSSSSSGGSSSSSSSGR